MGKQNHSFKSSLGKKHEVCGLYLCEFDLENILHNKQMLVKSLKYEKISIYIYIYIYLFFFASVENDRVCQIQYEKDYDLL